MAVTAKSPNAERVSILIRRLGAPAVFAPTCTLVRFLYRFGTSASGISRFAMVRDHAGIASESRSCSAHAENEGPVVHHDDPWWRQPTPPHGNAGNSRNRSLVVLILAPLLGKVLP